MRLRAAVVLVAFAAAVWLRVLLGRPQVAQSQLAALVYAAALLGLALAAGTRVMMTRSALLLGLGGSALVVAPVAIEHLVRLERLHSAHGFLSWAVVVVVATAEEVYLRGTLYDAMCDLAGPWAAIAVGAACFAVLHVPLYGWHVLPLDLAVGVVLGGLRRASGTPAAPAITHVGADLVGWFVR